MPTDPNHLAILPPEQQRIRDKCYHPRGTFIAYPKEAIEQSIPERFEEMVRRYSDRLAVKTHDQAFTYAELNEMANRVAHAILRQRGDGPEPVAILFEQGVEAIAAMLGVLKAGKCYVPLDPDYPQARIAYMLGDAQASLVVTNTPRLPLARRLDSHACQWLNVSALDANASHGNPGLTLAPDVLAYIIYTSGSTGLPKGVMQSHRNVLHKIMEYTNSLHICAEDRLTLLYSLSSSSSVWDIFSALCNGASLYPYILRDERIGSLAPWLQQEAITIYSSVPTLFRQVLGTMAGAEIFPSLRLMFLGGETVTRRDVALYKAHFSRDCLLVTSLAATETGTFCRYYIDAETQTTGAAVPVGYVLPDKDVLIVDEDGTEMGLDRLGEIVVRSRYLSPGYWRRPDLTQARFLSAPEGAGVRLYRTGDLGRMRPDGCLMHMGREDFQVKIRGHRVEIAEIETALLQLDAVKEVVVIQREDQPGVPRLTAYVVPASRPEPTVSALRGALATTLPSHMIPSAFVMLDHLPLTPARKVDRQALPAPDGSRPPLEHDYVSPRTPIEEELTVIWADVLGLDPVGIHDPFLDLGGHSLMATQLLSRVIETFQVDLPLRTLMETPTIAEMAVVITQHQAAQAAPDTVARLLAEVEALADGPARTTLSPAQK